jgi:cytidylate kinase
MNHLKIIQQFIKEKRSVDELPATGFPFVTISRQAGAGGHLLSYVILTEFLKYERQELFEGWHVFDKQLCEVVAQDPSIQGSFETLLKEKLQPEFRDFLESLFTGHSNQYTLQKTTFKVLRMLALLGKVIIVGRAGSLVSADLPQGIHIRLVAPEPQRIVWMMKRFKLSKEEARTAIAKQDSDRKKLIRMFFHRDIDDPLLYDITVNTGKVGLDVICHSAIELIRVRAAQQAKRAAPAN